MSVNYRGRILSSVEIVDLLKTFWRLPKVKAYLTELSYDFHRQSPIE
jgi:hypothetical protein